jgi:hypothetical protein
MRPEIILTVATAALAHPAIPQHIYYKVPAITPGTSATSSLKRKFSEDTSPSRIITSQANLQPSPKRHSTNSSSSTKPPPFLNIDRINKPHHLTHHTPPGSMNSSAHPEFNEFYELEKRQFSRCTCWIPWGIPESQWKRSDPEVDDDYKCHGEKLKACFHFRNPCKPL